jgi:hypothetical protein
MNLTEAAQRGYQYGWPTWACAGAILFGFLLLVIFGRGGKHRR